jgi:REP element-mobilizing transposase RayT
MTGQSKGWYSRGYLPHFDGGETAQFLTFRLADSLPQSVLDNWLLELESGIINNAYFRRSVELYLDNGWGECFLRETAVAEKIEENLLHFDRQKYKLHAWVIMPNHVHLLLSPLPGFALSSITHSIKSFMATAANKILNRTGRFWFPETFDRYIRNYEHFENTFNYIENNPIKAGLCRKPEDWRFSSAYHRKEK